MFGISQQPPRVSLRQLTGSVVGLKRSLAQIFAVAVVLEMFAIVADEEGQLSRAAFDAVFAALATKADREKTRLSSQLVQQVYDRNGLFWKKRTDGSDVWEEVSFKVARSKASQALRDGRKAPATGEGQLH